MPFKIQRGDMPTLADYYELSQRMRALSVVSGKSLLSVRQPGTSPSPYFMFYDTEGGMSLNNDMMKKLFNSYKFEKITRVEFDDIVSDDASLIPADDVSLFLMRYSRLSWFDNFEVEIMCDETNRWIFTLDGKDSDVSNTFYINEMPDGLISVAEHLNMFSLSDALFTGRQQLYMGDHFYEEFIDDYTTE